MSIKKVVAEDINRVENKMQKLEEQSIAWQVVKESNEKYNKLFIIWIITFIAFISLLGYTLWLLNDIGVQETTTTTKTQEISDLNDINNSNIVNGDFNGEDKTSNKNN